MSILPRLLLSVFILLSSCNCTHKVEETVAEPDAIQVEADEPAKASPTILKDDSKYFTPIIALTGRVDEKMAKEFTALMDAAQEAKAISIIIEINSGGGDIDSGVVISKAIEDSKMRTVCIVDTEAASMANYILQSCTIRLMTKRSAIMIHQPQLNYGEFKGTQVTFKNAGSALEAINKAMAEQLTKKTKLKPQELLKKIPGPTEWWINWDEALKYGIVDGICESTQQVAASMRDTNKVPYSKH